MLFSQRWDFVPSVRMSSDDETEIRATLDGRNANEFSPPVTLRQHNSEEKTRIVPARCCSAHLIKMPSCRHSNVSNSITYGSEPVEVRSRCTRCSWNTSIMPLTCTLFVAWHS